MGTTGIGQRETRRKGLITGAVGGALIIAALVISLAYWGGASRREKPVVLPESVPVDVHQQLSGYTFTRSDGGRRIFTVHAARTVSFKQGGTTVLEDVMVELFGRTGNRHDIMRTHRCDYNNQSGDLVTSGPVQMELNAQSEGQSTGESRGKPAVHLETSEVSYQHDGAMVMSDQEVRFQIGPASGVAMGMVYATKDGWLELEKNLVMELRPQDSTKPGPPIRLSASRLRYDKLNRKIMLWGPIQSSQGDRTILADNGKLFLNEANRVTRWELEGNIKSLDVAAAKIVKLSCDLAQGDLDPVSGEINHLSAEGNVAGESRGKGSISLFNADKLELWLAGTPSKVENGDGSGKVQLVIESIPPMGQGDKKTGQKIADKKILSATELKFGFRPDGKSVKDVQTVGPAKLVIDPADTKVGQRIITAGQLLMSLNPQSTIETIRGLKPTRIVFQPPRNAPPGSTPQESTADTFLATFDEATHDLKDMKQSGNYTFHDGERNASAQDSVYVASTQGVTLTGHPQVWDAETRMKAERLLFDLRNNTAEGIGKVQGSHLGIEKQKPGSPAQDPANATNVLADHMVAQKRSQVIHYDGNVRAWRGTDVVESSSLDIWRAEKRLSSGSKVLTSHLQPASHTQGETPDTSMTQHEGGPLTVRADLLEYFNEGSKASYRGHVRLQTGTTDMNADKMDVYFSQAGTTQATEVDHAVAEGHVVVLQPGRRATGEHGEYSSTPGEIVLTGGNPTIYDVEKGLTTGQRLTLFVHDDRLLVDGGAGSPSMTKHRVAH